MKPKNRVIAMPTSNASNATIPKVAERVCSAFDCPHREHLRVP